MVYSKILAAFLKNFYYIKTQKQRKGLQAKR